MKGVIAAAGKGSRLFPLTNSISKHLLPVYNKPMIYYPITNLIACGINEICIVTNPHESKLYKKLLGTGSQLGCKFEFFEQEKPAGIPDVLNYALEIFGKKPVTLVLGDNVFAANDTLVNSMREKKISGAKVFATKVDNPKKFGVVEFNKKMEVVSLKEKPINPQSNYAVIGLYIFDETVFDYLKELNPSKRGELEIVDLLNNYFYNNHLSLEILRRGSVWFDAGTPESLLSAGLFIETFENQSGVMIGCIEEAAFMRNFITKKKLSSIVKSMPKSIYKEYLVKLLKE